MAKKKKPLMSYVAFKRDVLLATKQITIEKKAFDDQMREISEQYTHRTKKIVTYLLESRLMEDVEFLVDGRSITSGPFTAFARKIEQTTPRAKLALSKLQWMLEQVTDESRVVVWEGNNLEVMLETTRYGVSLLVTHDGDAKECMDAIRTLPINIVWDCKVVALLHSYMRSAATLRLFCAAFERRGDD